MIKNRTINVKSIKNEEILMTKTIQITIKTVIITILIMIIMMIKIRNRIKL